MTSNKRLPGKQTADVLLVEDDRILLRILSLALTQRQMRVVAVESADEALEQLNYIEPEAIISDINLPGLSGYDFLRRVRGMGLLDVPFLFCSGNNRASDRIQGLTLGAEDYLVKPIIPEEMVLKVQAQIRKKHYLRALRAAVERTDMESSQSLLKGNLSSMTVADVLQMTLMLGQGNYRVRIENEDDSGIIYLRAGVVCQAETGWHFGHKAFFRMLSWNSGTFSVDDSTFEEEPSLSSRLEDILLDGLTRLDEYRLRLAELIQEGSHFESCTIAENLSPLSKAENELLQLLQQQQHLPRILDCSPLSDLEIVTTLLELKKDGVIRAIKATAHSS